VRLLLQRVSRAEVRVGERVTGRIGVGYLVFLGVTHSDDQAGVQWMADKVADLRLFGDDEGKMNRGLADVGGAVLVVSQFTLFGDVRKGRRPSFVAAAPPALGRTCYEAFVEAARELVPHVATGEFGADMAVTSVNDGPVTILIDTTRLF